MVSKKDQDFKKLTAAKKKTEAKKKQKVKVNVKKIHVPLNAPNEPVSEAARISTLIKHYQKDGQILQALTGTKTFLNGCADPNQYLTTVYREIFSLVTHEEVEIRKKLKETLKFIVNKFDSSPLQSTLTTVITYLCSGLTHLSKNIRFTTLEIFAIVLEKVPDSIFDYFAKVFPLVLGLLSEKSVLDPISAEMLRSSSQMSGKGKQSSRQKYIFDLTLSVLRTMSLSAENREKHHALSVKEGIKLYSQPIVILGPRLYWISAFSHGLTKAFASDHEEGVQQLIGKFFYQIQQIFIDFIASCGIHINDEAIRLLSQVLSNIIEFMEAYDFCREKVWFHKNLSSCFPFQITDNQQSVVTSMKLTNLNLQICQILSLVRSKEDRSLAKLETKFKRFIYSALEDVSFNQVLETEQSDLVAEETNLAKKQLYRGIFYNLSHIIDDIPDLILITQRFESLLKQFQSYYFRLPINDQKTEIVVIDRHLVNRGAATVKAMAIRTLQFSQLELTSQVLSSQIVLVSSFVTILLQRVQHFSFFSPQYRDWILLLRDLFIRFNELIEESPEQQILQACSSQLHYVFEINGSEPTKQNENFVYSFSAQSLDYQFGWIDLLYYLPNDVLSCLLEKMTTHYYCGYHRLIQENVHFIVGKRVTQSIQRGKELTSIQSLSSFLPIMEKIWMSDGGNREG